MLNADNIASIAVRDFQVIVYVQSIIIKRCKYIYESVVNISLQKVRKLFTQDKMLFKMFLIVASAFVIQLTEIILLCNYCLLSFSKLQSTAGQKCEWQSEFFLFNTMIQPVYKPDVLQSWVCGSLIRFLSVVSEK